MDVRRPRPAWLRSFREQGATRALLEHDGGVAVQTTKRWATALERLTRVGEP